MVNAMVCVLPGLMFTAAGGFGLTLIVKGERTADTFTPTAGVLLAGVMTKLPALVPGASWLVTAVTLMANGLPEAVPVDGETCSHGGAPETVNPSWLLSVVAIRTFCDGGFDLL